MKTSQQKADELLALWRKGREAGIPPQDRLDDNIFHEPNPFGPGTGASIEQIKEREDREWKNASEEVRTVAKRHACSIDMVYEYYAAEVRFEIDRKATQGFEMLMFGVSILAFLFLTIIFR
jgi:hypothetical protein